MFVLNVVTNEQELSLCMVFNNKEDAIKRAVEDYQETLNNVNSNEFAEKIKDNTEELITYLNEYGEYYAFSEDIYYITECQVN